MPVSLMLKVSNDKKNSVGFMPRLKGGMDEILALMF